MWDDNSTKSRLCYLGRQIKLFVGLIIQQSTRIKQYFFLMQVSKIIVQLSFFFVIATDPDTFNGFTA